MRQSRHQQLVERVDALDARLKALRQQQDRITKQRKQIKLRKAQQAVAASTKH